MSNDRATSAGGTPAVEVMASHSDSNPAANPVAGVDAFFMALGEIAKKLQDDVNDRLAAVARGNDSTWKKAA